MRAIFLQDDFQTKPNNIVAMNQFAAAKLIEVLINYDFWQVVYNTQSSFRILLIQLNDTYTYED